MTTDTLRAPSAAQSRSPSDRIEVKPVLTAESYRADTAVHDRLLAWLTVMLAFLLASFPVGNSDIFRSMAAGRMIAEGTFVFGEDPFTYSGAIHAELNDQAKPVWIHVSWLFDWLVYQVYLFAGGPGLVLLRGVAFALTAFFLLQIRLPGGTRLPAVFMAALAMVVAAAQLSLRSDLMSLLMLSVTLFMLSRSWWCWLALPAVFALWANLDRWFLLGPAAVGAGLVGGLIQAVIAAALPSGRPLKPDESLALEVPNARHLGVLSLVLLAGVAACLATPYGTAVFAQANPWAEPPAAFRAFQQADPHYAQLVHLPELPGATSRTATGRSIADWCYYPLVALSILSFVLNWRRPLAGGLAFWAALFAWSWWSPAGLGPFAIAAAPMAALSFQRFWADRSLAAGDRLPPPWMLAAAQAVRFAVLLFVVVLGALMMVPTADAETASRGGTAGGLVHSGGSVEWSLRENETLRQSSLKLAEWRKNGELSGNGLNLAMVLPEDLLVPFTEIRGTFDRPEYKTVENPFRQPHPLARVWSAHANYWAWYQSINGDPGKAFMDHRFGVPPEVAEDFLKASRGICGLVRKYPYEATSEWRARARECDADWKEVFRKYQISHIVVDGYAGVPKLTPLRARDGTPLTDERGKTRHLANSRYLIDLLLVDRDEHGHRQWSVLKYDDGRTFVVAWTGSDAWKSSPPMQELQFSASGEVFGRTEDGRPYGKPTRPPALRGPIQETREGGWKALLQGSRRRQPLALERARFYQGRFAQELSSLESSLGAVQLPASMGLIGSQLSLGFPTPTIQGIGQLHEAQAFLAIQSSRQAIAERPDLVEGYAALMQAYAGMSNMEAFCLYPPELTRALTNPPREFAVMSMWRQIAALQPDDPNVHQSLIHLYRERQCLDLLIAHYLAMLDTAAPHRRDRTVPADEFKRQYRRAFSEQHGIRDLDALVAARAEMLERVKSVNDPIQRAADLLNNNLPDDARRDLEQSLREHSPGTDAKKAFVLMAQCYVRMGAGFELYRWLTIRSDAAELLGAERYHEYRSLAATAYGDYETALESLEYLDRLKMSTAIGQSTEAFRWQILGGGQLAPWSPGTPPTVTGGMVHGGGGPFHATMITVGRADTLVIAGVLALEAGQPQRAREYFRRAIQDVHADCAFQLVARRYYYLITGESLAPR